MISFKLVFLLELNINLSILLFEKINLYKPLHISLACEKSPNMFSLIIPFKKFFFLLIIALITFGIINF